MPNAISGASLGADASSALSAVAGLGADVGESGGVVEITPGTAPADEVVVDAGNSGTTARFVLGWAAGGAGVVRVKGDDSLHSRPVGPLAEDLSAWGATVRADGADVRFPATAVGPVEGPLTTTMSPGSGTRKGALLLASARSGAPLEWEESPRSRDHSERMLSWAGLWPEKVAPGVERLPVAIPPDASAFAVMAGLAALVPMSEVSGRTLMGPRREGFLRYLDKAGVDVVRRRDESWPEQVGWIQVRRSGDLSPGELVVEGQDLMDMVDEVPLAAVVAMARKGTTEFRDAEVLRSKESDRLTATARLVRGLGGEAEVVGGSLRVMGQSGEIAGGAPPTAGDHRLVLAAAVAGAGSKDGVELLESQWGAVAFPGWERAFAAVGVDLA